MNAEGVVAVVTAVGVVIAGLWKGLPAVVRAIGSAIRDRDREIQKVKDDAAKTVEVERKAAHERAVADLTRATKDLDDVRCELETARAAEQECKVTLARALAWLAHLESALKANGIEYVPFNEAGRADSDEARHRQKPRGGKQ